jgi:peptidoglycan/xylan/chitin deacetylase (PgdA/CDA1 family)
MRALHRRALTDAWLKALGTTAGMTGFFILYFLVQNNPVFPVTILPESWLDHLVGFQPWALVPYLSLWFYITLAPALLTERRQLLGFAAGCAVLAALGLATFLLWPTAAPPPAIDWSLHPGFEFLKTADATGNACPSLHVAYAVFTALWLARILPALGAGLIVQFANLLWAGLIVFSTLATKQHVALDALCGAILGAWVGSLNLHACPPEPGAPSLRRPLFISVAVIKLSAVLLWSIGLPFGLCLALFLSAGALVLHQLFAPGAGELVRVRTRFTPSAPDAREVWLTLDDGPDPDDTPRILDLLDQHRARATFFLIGQRAAKHPALVAEIVRRGHEIAHHTHTHSTATFWCAFPARVRRELDDALAAFAAADVTLPRRFRPPVGIKNLFLAPALAARRLDCIGWTIRSRDTFATDPAAVAARVARRLRPGAIILLHEGPPLRPAVRVAALASVLDLLHARGYRTIIPTIDALR